MKKLSLLFALLSLAGAAAAQESGNRIYGNRGYYNQQRRQPTTNTGNLATPQRTGAYSIEASVITNLKPDAFVAVFGLSDEAKTPATSNERTGQRVEQFVRALAGLGVGKDDVFVDFITQSRVYDYTVQGAQAREGFTGFETKKTVAVRYRSRDLFERIVAAAAALQIFDLIKVDYVVSDFDSVRARLFEAAVKVIKAKEARYADSLGVRLTPFGLASEKYDAFYPSDSYERYQAYETGEAHTTYSNASKVVQRKSVTFYYEPFDASRFDAVVAPAGIEPVVQFTLYLRMDYEAGRPRDM